MRKKCSKIKSLAWIPMVDKKATIITDPCDRCDGEGADCKNCTHVREWLKSLKADK